VSWFACHRSDEYFALIREDQKAFCLLSLVAARARYTEDVCPVTKLGYGQAFIGDFKEAGFKTRQAYRLACKRLFKSGFLTIQGTNKGTIATLLPQDVFSISTLEKEPAKEPTRNQRGTNEEPLRTKEQGNNENKNTILPVGWQKLSKTEQGRKKVNFNTPLMIRLGKFFGQKESTLWTVAEYIALQDVNPPEEEIELIEDHFSLEIEKNGFRHTALITLLNNWPAARNRAVAYFQEFPTHRNA